jgi:glycosyltransferase involved in cell wall biosynthesis
MHLEIREAVQQWHPDIVHVDLPMMSSYWKDIKKFSKVVASHDTISLFAYKNYKSRTNLFKKAMWYLLYKQRQWVERTYYPHYDACTLVSVEDKTFLKKHCQDLRIEIIPSGVDIEYFKQGELNAESSIQPAVGFFGSVDFLPNVDAVIYFVSEIYPMIKKAIPDIKFFIVGRNPTVQIKSLADNKSIFVTGEVDDIREYYQKVSVVVAPTRLGSGIKNTVLQAMSMSKPVVTTTQAVKAIDAEDGVHLMIADESNKFAEKVIAVLENKKLQETLGNNARDLIVRRYSWESHANAFQSLYESILLKKSQSKYARNAENIS